MEITMEVNPGDLKDNQTASNWKEMGITRLSLGIQSLREKDLQILDRKHTAAEAFRACEIATDEFDQVSIDLIYGRTREDSPDEWRQELRQALSLGAKHLSLYSLTLKPRTQLHKLVRKGNRHLTSEKSVVEMMHINLEETKVVKGHECAHNMAYWTMGDYIGVGPGAHSRFSVGADYHSLKEKEPQSSIESAEKTKRRVGLRQIMSPQQWTKAMEGDGSRVDQEEIISGKDVVMERILVGLRMTKGLPLSQWSDAVDRGVINNEAVDELVARELIKIDNERVRVSEEGFLLLDAVTAKLLV
uniref:Oxygen-independent coproporphyrinogen III oxidase n=1 Tax=Paramoeba pemaquidensis TaxID=180228 RepID=A0A167HDI0_9EUKA|nr:oxygen-independent coproporphyrinogen III oxidase [Paramoeba pemaquidensis]